MKQVVPIIRSPPPCTENYIISKSAVDNICNSSLEQLLMERKISKERA